ncbi:MAG TPA: hypothetical protein VJJ23_02950 [Candidatus Nanoarchaeia archaeon]|nr:hypothetical protein [Candidatus Nanoarchaeia archaeon]
MMKDRLPTKLKTGTFVNWEGVVEDIDTPLLRGLDPNQDNENYKKEVKKTFKNLELGHLGNNIVRLWTRNMVDVNQERFIDNLVERLSNPFIDRSVIEQIHMGVEELIGNPSFFGSVQKGLHNHHIEIIDIKQSFLAGNIDFITFERGSLESYDILRKVLLKSDNKLFRDLADIFGSFHIVGNPVADYYNIVNSRHLKIVGDINGFRLYQKKDSLYVDSLDKKNFTNEEKFIKICMEMSVQRQKAYKILEGSSDFLEYIAAMALWGNINKFTKPTFNNDEVLDIKEGYHPLLISRNGINFNPIVTHDTLLTPDVKVVAVTGPNAAGKTTYIKELGLISSLAQSGSYVSAKMANLPVQRKFLTHFGSKDDIMENLSLYQAEIHELNVCLSKLEKGVLFICDELFRGTESGENGGTRLHKALVESLVYDYQGRTYLSSHYHESLAQQRDLQGIKFARFGFNGDGRPSYKLQSGIDKGGYAVQSAIDAGLDKKVVKRLNGNGKL